MKSKIIKISIIAALFAWAHAPARALSEIVTYGKRVASLAKAHPRKTVCLLAASAVMGDYVGAWWSKKRVEKAQIAFNQALTTQQEFFKKNKTVIERADRGALKIAQCLFEFNQSSLSFMLDYYALERALQQQYDPLWIRLSGRSVPADFALVKKYKPCMDELSAEDNRSFKACMAIRRGRAYNESFEELHKAGFDRARAHMKIFEKHGLLPQEGK